MFYSVMSVYNHTATFLFACENYVNTKASDHHPIEVSGRKALTEVQCGITPGEISHALSSRQERQHANISLSVNGLK